jgi:hypothetical protein
MDVAYGPDRHVLPTLGSTNNLGLSVAHVRLQPDRDALPMLEGLDGRLK